MIFSRAQSKLRAIEIKQRQAKAKIRTNSDYKLQHPGEARDAATGKYTLLLKRVKEETEKKQLRNETFQRKLHQDG